MSTIQESDAFVACPLVDPVLMPRLGTRWAAYHHTYEGLADRFFPDRAAFSAFSNVTISEINLLRRDPDVNMVELPDGLVPREDADGNVIPFDYLVSPEDYAVATKVQQLFAKQAGLIVWQMYFIALANTAWKMGPFENRGRPPGS